MTDDQDKELEQYLEGDSKPSSAYAELGDETPPPELDARILAAAEREVKVTGIDAQRSPPFKAFAWAAIVVLSFSLVLNIVFDEAVREPLPEFDGFPEVQRSLPAGRENGSAQEDSQPARQVQLKARRDQPADLPTDSDRAQRAHNAEEIREQEVMFASERKRESVAEEQLGAKLLMDLSEDGRIEQLEEPEALAASSAPVLTAMPAKSQPEADDTVRAQVVQVLEDYSAQVGKSVPATESADLGIQELRRYSVATRGPNAELGEILTEFYANRDDKAFTLLSKFREAYPDHPVTIALVESGL